MRTEHGELLPDPDAEVEVEDETAGFLAVGALTMVHARSEFSADDDYFALPGTRSIDEAAAALPAQLGDEARHCFVVAVTPVDLGCDRPGLWGGWDDSNARRQAVVSSPPDPALARADARRPDP